MAQLFQALQVNFYHFVDNRYIRAKVVPPYINFCMGGFDLPPYYTPVFSSDRYMCVNDMEVDDHSAANAAVFYGNTVTGLAMRLEIAVEERLDRPEVHVFFVILAMLLALELPERAQDSVTPPKNKLSKREKKFARM